MTTNGVLQIIIPLIISYLIGSIPFSYIIGKANGVDVREEGSKNPGASNVLRLCGKKAGTLAYICDIGKGILAIYISSLLIDYNRSFILVIAAVAAILGHIFPIFLGFKGGKGVATSAGVMFMLAPITLIIAMIFFFIGLFASKKTVAIGSTTGAVSFPIVLTILRFFAPSLYKIFFNVDYKLLFPISVLLVIFIIIKHIPNYKRILKGEENSFSKK